MNESKERAKATAAASPLVFADGTTFQMSPLTDRDIAELDLWVQARIVQIARASLNGEPAEIREETLRLAMQTAAGASWMTGMGARIMATVPGMTRLVWQSIKRSHPEITEEEVGQHLFSPENIEHARETFDKLNLEGKKGVKKKRPGARRKGKSTVRSQKRTATRRKTSRK